MGKGWSGTPGKGNGESKSREAEGSLGSFVLQMPRAMRLHADAGAVGWGESHARPQVQGNPTGAASNDRVILISF